MEARAAIASLAASVTEDELEAAVLCRVDGLTQPEAAGCWGSRRGRSGGSSIGSTSGPRPSERSGLMTPKTMDVPRSRSTSTGRRTDRDAAGAAPRGVRAVPRVPREPRDNLRGPAAPCRVRPGSRRPPLGASRRRARALALAAGVALFVRGGDRRAGVRRGEGDTGGAAPRAPRGEDEDMGRPLAVRPGDALALRVGCEGLGHVAVAPPGGAGGALSEPRARHGGAAAVHARGGRAAGRRARCRHQQGHSTTGAQRPVVEPLVAHHDGDRLAARHGVDDEGEGQRLGRGRASGVGDPLPAPPLRRCDGNAIQSLAGHAEGERISRPNRGAPIPDPGARLAVNEHLHGRGPLDADVLPLGRSPSYEQQDARRERDRGGNRRGNRPAALVAHPGAERQGRPNVAERLEAFEVTPASRAFGEVLLEDGVRGSPGRPVHVERERRHVRIGLRRHDDSSFRNGRVRSSNRSSIRRTVLSETPSTVAASGCGRPSMRQSTAAAARLPARIRRARRWSPSPRRKRVRRSSRVRRRRSLHPRRSVADRAGRQWRDVSQCGTATPSPNADRRPPRPTSTNEGTPPVRRPPRRAPDRAAVGTWHERAGESVRRRGRSRSSNSRKVALPWTNGEALPIRPPCRHSSPPDRPAGRRGVPPGDPSGDLWRRARIGAGGEASRRRAAAWQGASLRGCPSYVETAGRPPAGARIDGSRESSRPRRRAQT